MVCAKLGYWPFKQQPWEASAAQINILTKVYIDMQPKQEDENNRAPHGQVDKFTMKQWRERVVQERSDATV